MTPLNFCSKSKAIQNLSCGLIVLLVLNVILLFFNYGFTFYNSQSQAVDHTKDAISIVQIVETPKPQPQSQSPNKKTMKEQLVSEDDKFDATSNEKLEEVAPRKFAGDTSLHFDVCLAFLSCRRYDLLQRVVAAALEHMKYEPISFEVSIVDNGSNFTKFYDQIISKFPEIDNYVLYRKNRGIAYGLNTLYFDSCRRSDYILTMEDDWLWNMSLIKIPIIKQAIEVLQLESQTLIGVALRQLGLKEDDIWTKTESGKWKCFVCFESL